MRTALYWDISQRVVVTQKNAVLIHPSSSVCMALSLVISPVQNNDLTLSKVFKFKILFFAGLATQKVCSSRMITYIVRQERDRAMNFEIQQEYIVILLLKV